jgi:hypothetical protein
MSELNNNQQHDLQTIVNDLQSVNQELVKNQTNQLENLSTQISEDELFKKIENAHNILLKAIITTNILEVKNREAIHQLMTDTNQKQSLKIKELLQKISNKTKNTINDSEKKTIDVANILRLIENTDVIFSSTQLEELLKLLTSKKEAKEVLMKFVTDLSNNSEDFKKKCTVNRELLTEWMTRITNAMNKINKFSNAAQRMNITTEMKKNITEEVKSNLAKLKILEQDYFISNNIISLENCNKTQQSLISLAKNNRIVQDIEDYATNLEEDVTGTVRIYVRINDEPGHVSGTKNNQKSYFTSNIKVDKKNVKLDFTTFGNNISDSDNQKEKIKCKNTKGKFGPFFDVFDKGTSAQDIFSGTKQGSNLYDEDSMKLNDVGRQFRSGLFKTIAQIQDGYSIILSGYGLSGAGKTYTLFGPEIESKTNEDKGLIFYSLENIINVRNYEILSIFEETNSQAQNYVSNVFSIQGNLLYLFGNHQEFENIKNHIDSKTTYRNNSCIDKTTDFLHFDRTNNTVKSKYFSDGSYKKFLSTLKAILKKVRLYRIKNKRILKTSNNSDSSRSHLYIVLKLSFKNNKVGFLTIVDQAGRENPFEINRNMLKRQTISYTLINEDKNEQIINQGLYIADSLYNLKMFYLWKVGKNPTAIEKSNDISIEPKINSDNTKREEQFLNASFANIQKFFNIKKTCIGNSKNTLYRTIDCQNIKTSTSIILTIPIMQYLDKLSNDPNNNTRYRPSKFVFILAIRTGSKYCLDTKETLEFGLEISGQ